MAKGGAVLKRQTGYRFRGSWLDAALSLILVLSLGCGHIVRNAPNHPGVVFDFEHPPCSPAMKPTKTLPDDEVEIRYLGAAGLYLHWGGNSILLGPFFSNPSFLHALFGRWRADEMAIERGLAGVPVSEVEAVFAGHSHYDHIGDLPIILSRAGRAQVFVNRSGVHALVPYAAARSTSFEDKIGEWVWLNQPSGERAPIRFLAVPSDHAPQVDHYLWAKGKIKRAWREPWSSHYFHSLKAGQTFALVIDLMANDLRTVRYRIYYQDAASRRGVGEPPSFPDGHPYDLAVLCMASYDKAPGQPESILGILHPRHVMVTHYEDFFQSQDRPVRFVGLLTNGKVDRYLRTICVKLGCEGQSSAGPITPVCGPSGARWTMPLPGEWMRFAVVDRNQGRKPHSTFLNPSGKAPSNPASNDL